MSTGLRILIAVQQAVWPLLPRSAQCWFNRVVGGWLLKRNLKRNPPTDQFRARPLGRKLQ